MNTPRTSCFLIELARIRISSTLTTVQHYFKMRIAAGLATYIGNNASAITDYAARWDHGEIISTAFAESTVDLVISRRFAKKQQMQWSKTGAHRLLQTRTRTLDGTLHDLFTSWYPAMPANDVQPLPLATAA